MSTTRARLNAVEKIEQILSAKKQILLNEAIHSSDPNDLLKANTMIEQINQRKSGDRKSYIIDPYEFNSFLGYKDKAFSMSYTMLKRISYVVPIVRAIINTRIDQITSFCEPQTDKYSTGFVIRKKKSYYNQESKEMTKAEMKRCDELTDMVLNCGMENQFGTDDFDAFTRKVMNDSLTYDQMTWEIVSDRRGRPYEVIATDASTFRITDSFDDEEYNPLSQRNTNLERVKQKGYYPSYCQIHDGKIVSDFYPWELCFGVRNPTTNIYANGYGVSEIEMLMNTVTSMLWAEEYNRKFFSQGSAPKGLIKIKNGLGVNDGTISQFKQQWQSMMSGVTNAWKTPVLQGDIDWIDLQKSNNDMEFSSWMEYLIKITCAIFRIDPAEINFPLSGSSDQKPMFEGNNEARLKHSKDKGLYPILKMYQRKLNKYWISRVDPSYELVFCGMEGMTFAEELDQHTKMVSNFATLDEVRIMRGLKPLGKENGGDLILNSSYIQQLNAKQQQEMMQQQQNAGGMMGEEDQGEDQQGEDEEENPFEKAFNSYWEKLNAA